jgi:hypothetical protein
MERRMRTEQGSKDAGLALPAGWEKGHPRWLTASILFLAGLVLLFILGAAWAFATGDAAAGILLAAGALYMGHVVGLGTIGWRVSRPTRRGPRLTVQSDGSRGIEFRYSWWPYYWFIACAVPSIGIVVVLVAANLTAATVAGYALATLFAAGAIATIWVVVICLRLMPGVVILSPDGIFYRDLTYTYFVPWHAIVEVTTIWGKTPFIIVKAFPSNDSRLRRYTGRVTFGDPYFFPFIAINARWLATNPVLVYHALAFYCDHPDRRAELGLASGLERINRGAFRVER